MKRTILESVLAALLLGAVAGLVATGRAEIPIVENRLAVDAYMQNSTQFWMVDVAGLKSTRFRFDPVSAYVGATARVSSTTSIRLALAASAFSSPWLSDAYADVAWPNGFGLRIGQFLLPLGVEAMTAPESLDLTGGSLVGAYTKPNGPRDLGALATYSGSLFEAAAAVVNGTGASAWAPENVKRKDVCARVLARPWCGGPRFAARVYRGTETTGVVWLTVAGEFMYDRAPFSIRAEAQNHAYRDIHNNAAYAQLTYDLGRLEPSVKLDLLKPGGQKLEILAEAGVQARMAGDAFRVLLSYSYHRNFQGDWTVGAILLALRVGI